MCSFKIHIVSVQSKTNTLGSPKSMPTYKTDVKKTKTKIQQPVYRCRANWFRLKTIYSFGSRPHFIYSAVIIPGSVSQTTTTFSVQRLMQPACNTLRLTLRAHHAYEWFANDSVILELPPSKAMPKMSVICTPCFGCNCIQLNPYKRTVLHKAL